MVGEPFGGRLSAVVVVRGLANLRAGLALVAALFGQSVDAVGWNVDFDNRGAPPEVGGGLPSNSFGAAAGQAGRWNSVPATAGGIWPLVDVFGNATGVRYHGDGMSGGGGGYNDPYNFGDYRLLMNDYNQVFTHNWFYLTGLPSGRYRVWTYAATPWREVAPVRISVSGAEPGQNPQTVTGPLTPNEFEYLITHSIHDVSVTDGTLRWDLVNDPFIPGVIVNGFQVVPVPEPGGLITMGGALAALVVWRRRIRP
ncbi:hypothetical protein FCG40_11315 [Fimbriimonadia bacterium ATM]|nr:hypothetical protein [Fimbriimonadia bacterium ATM]